MVDGKPRPTSYEIETSDEVDLKESKPYREIIGSLIYIQWLQHDQIFVMHFLVCLKT